MAYIMFIYAGLFTFAITTKQKVKGYLQRKLIKPLLGFLKTGMSPTKLAIGVALGFVIGIIPIVGITTVLCAVVAYIFRINMAVVQLANYIVYPLQVIFFIPFIKFGIYVFGVNPLPYPIDAIWDRLQSNFIGTISDIWWANLLGVLIWLAIAPILYISVFLSSTYLIKKLYKKEKE